MKTIATIFTFVLIAFNQAIAQDKNNSSSNTIESLTKAIEEVYKNSGIPGFSCVVVDSDKILYQGSFGFADINSKSPFTHETVQNIGSISKTFIALAIMKAVEQGKVELDTDINTYLPFKVIHPKYPEVPITLRQLSNHTSGINDGKVYDKSYVIENYSEVNFAILPPTIGDYIISLKDNEKIDDSRFLENALSKDGIWFSKKNFTRKKPGKKYVYSNLGAALAALVIENAVNMTYEDYTRKYIFAPLKMTETGWDENDLTIKNHATRYFSKEIVVPNYSLITKADGALITNTTDFASYLIEMMKGYNGAGILISSKGYTEMFTRKEFGKEASGIFWGVSENAVLNHSGSDPGIGALTAINTKNNLGCFLMTNTNIDMDEDVLNSIKAVWKELKEYHWNETK